MPRLTFSLYTIMLISASTRAAQAGPAPISRTCPSRTSPCPQCARAARNPQTSSRVDRGTAVPHRTTSTSRGLLVATRECRISKMRTPGSILRLARIASLLTCEQGFAQLGDMVCVRTAMSSAHGKAIQGQSTRMYCSSRHTCPACLIDWRPERIWFVRLSAMRSNVFGMDPSFAEYIILAINDSVPLVN